MIKVSKAAAALALVLLPVIARAEPSAPRSFAYKGETYTYTTEEVGERRVLRGTAGKARAPFTLTVSKNWVNGTVNGNAVAFPIKSVERLRGIVTVEQVAVR